MDQDEAEYEGNEGAVIACSLLAAESDPFEPLEFADGLFDAGARLVEGFWEERSMRDDRADAVERNGVTVYRHDPRSSVTIASVDRAAFYQLKTMMQGVLARGTARTISGLTP